MWNINDLFYYGLSAEEESLNAPTSSISYDSGTGDWKYNLSKNIVENSFSYPITFIADVGSTTTTLVTDLIGTAEWIITSGNNRKKFLYETMINQDAINIDGLVSFDISKKISSLVRSWVQISTIVPDHNVFSLPDPDDPLYEIGDIIGITDGSLPIVYEAFHQLDWTWSSWVTDTITETHDETLTHINITYEDETTIEEYKYFNLLALYKGYDGLTLNYPLEVLETKRSYLEKLIDERKSLEAEITEIQGNLNNPSLSSDAYKNLEATLQSKKADLDAYLEACGTWDYDGGGFINNTTETSSIGKYGLIWSQYEFYYNQWLTSSITTINDPIYNRYVTVRNLKNQIWYNIKLLYDQYLLEGFYQNETEINPIALYYQAKLYLDIHKQPLDTYGITYLDISKVIGQNVNLVSVGDYINIYNYNLGIIEQLNNELRVVSINRDLRKSSDIQLTVDRIRNTQTILEKLLKSIQ